MTRYSFSRYARGAGFTLLELLVTIVVLAIIAAVGIPSFQTLVRTNRTVSYANEFVTELNAARSEAVSRRSAIIVCTSADGESCRADGDPLRTNWQRGWIVLLGAENRVLRQKRALKDIVNFSGESAQIVFDASGALANSGFVAFDLSLLGCEGEQGRLIEVGPTGRVGVLNATCS